MQRTPAGFPFGIPGIGELIDIEIQQAPQPERQSIVVLNQLIQLHDERIG